MPPELLLTLRVEVVTLLADATNCIDNKPHLSCGRKYLDDVLGMTDLNSYEAAMALNLDAYYWIRNGHADEAVWSYERMMELPQDEIPARLSFHARRLLDALYLLADRPAAGAACPDPARGDLVCRGSRLYGPGSAAPVEIPP